MTARHAADPDPAGDELAAEYDRRPLVESVWRLAGPVDHDPRRVARVIALIHIGRRLARRRPAVWAGVPRGRRPT